MAIVAATSALQAFSFESVNVRIVNIDGNPWFVAADVLAAMKSTRPVTTAVQMIEEDLGDGFTVSKPIVDSLNRTQDAVILHEAAVTLLISRSRTPMGKAFNRHLHSVILPTIRKTGKFVAHPEFDETASLKAQLKAVNDEILALKLLAAQEKLEKMKAVKVLSSNSKHVDELMPLVAKFCEDKTIVSLAEILYGLDPRFNHKAKTSHSRYKWVIQCLHQLNYRKTCYRHRILVNNRKMRVNSWELKA